MRFFKGFLVSLFLVGCFVYCTKNSVEGGITPTSVQMFNYFYSTSKTFSLLQGTDTVLSNVGFDALSQIASGAPGFYSLSFKDNGTDTILNGNINLQAGTRYSMFIVQDSTAGSDSVRYSLVTNTTTDPLPLYDSCRVRILNFARGIELLTLRFTINQGVGYGLLSPFFKTTTSQGRSYLDNNVYPQKAQYFTVPAAASATSGYQYQLRLLNFSNGADTSKAIDSTYITFQKQKLYTLLLLGKYDSLSSANHHYTYPDSFRLKIITE